MASANGFVTVRPDTTYGDSYSAYTKDYQYCQKFTAPGSGTLTITEIGLWGYGTSAEFAMAIFTHDATFDCPETMVSNSNTGPMTINSGSNVICYHTYGSTVQVTGGSTYWLCAMGKDNAPNHINVHRKATGGSGIYDLAPGYPTWGSGDDFHVHSDTGVDRSYYAVYTTGGETIVLTKFGAAYVGKNVNLNIHEKIQLALMALSYAGKNVAINIWEKIQAAAMSLSYAGQVVNLNIHETIQLVKQSLEWSGKSVTATAATVLQLAKATLEYSGQTIFLKEVFHLIKMSMSLTGKRIKILGEAIGSYISIFRRRRR